MEVDTSDWNDEDFEMAQELGELVQEQEKLKQIMKDMLKD